LVKGGDEDLTRCGAARWSSQCPGVAKYSRSHCGGGRVSAEDRSQWVIGGGCGAPVRVWQEVGPGGKQRFRVLGSHRAAALYSAGVCGKDSVGARLALQAGGPSRF
jgi:hypothetical protein